MIDKTDIDIINSFTVSELYVFTYLDKNKEEVIDLSVKELSEKTFVSTATVMRVAKKLGFSGFTELKYAIKQELDSRKSQSEARKSLEIVKQNLLNEVSITKDNLPDDEVKQVAAILKSKKRIHMFAKGLTLTVLEYAAKQLQTAYRPVYLYNDTHIAYINAEAFTEDDVIFLASLSGKTHQVIRVAQIAKSRGASIVTITGRRVNELSKMGDINFKVANERVGSTKHDFSSRLAMFYVLEVIIGIYLND